MKTYKYAVFLRCSRTKEIQHGTIEVDSDGDFMDSHELLKKMAMSENLKDFNKGYSLISMQIIDVWSTDE